MASTNISPPSSETSPVTVPPSNAGGSRRVGQPIGNPSIVPAAVHELKISSGDRTVDVPNGPPNSAVRKIRSNRLPHRLLSRRDRQEPWSSTVNHENQKDRNLLTKLPRERFGAEGTVKALENQILALSDKLSGFEKAHRELRKDHAYLLGMCGQLETKLGLKLKVEDSTALGSIRRRARRIRSSRSRWNRGSTSTSDMDEIEDAREEPCDWLTGLRSGKVMLIPRGRIGPSQRLLQLRKNTQRAMLSSDDDGRKGEPTVSKREEKKTSPARCKPYPPVLNVA